MNESREKYFRILVVDDDLTILELYERILVPQTSAPTLPLFDVTCCTQGDEAIKAVKRSFEEKAPYAVLFLDLNMPPGPDGQYTAEEIHELDPSLNIVMVTGYRRTDTGGVLHRPNFSNNLLYLQKPFHHMEIIQFATALSTKWLAEKQLMTLHSDLETLVERRTAELVESNMQLKIEIENRYRVQQERHRIWLADCRNRSPAP